MAGVRVALQQYRPNGGAAPAGQVFAITGICQDAHFRLQSSLFGGEHRPEDLALLYLGAPEFGPGSGAATGNEDEPYFILRRGYAGGEVVVTVRIDWEGIFTVLSNDDDFAELMFGELLQPSSPDDINRGWSDDPETLAAFEQILSLK
jgi:hypothetical protein